jgi:hypothetical protein
MRPADTSPEAWKVWLDVVRKMTPAERLQRAFEYSAFVRNLAESTLRREHPGASEREIFLRAARQRLGPAMFARVYGNELSV